MPAIQGNRAIAHIQPVQCNTPSDAAAAALSVRERRRSFFFVAEPPRIAEAPRPVKMEEPKVVPTLPDSIYPAYAEPHCLKAQTVNGNIAALETMTQPRYSIHEIQRAVCIVSDCARTDMLSARRSGFLLAPRHIAMTLCRMLTNRSLPYIGFKFGRRDHSTVHHAVSKYEWMIGPLRERVPEGSPAILYAEMAWKLYHERKAEKSAV